MKEQKYANGQKKMALDDNRMAHFFNNGTIKAEGPFENDQMQGEWKFYRKTGQLWQVGHFKDNQKEGPWVRYDKEGNIEYSESFRNNKQIKKQ